MDPVSTAAARQYPAVSIVVPTYNRAEQLAACLTSLFRQTYPRDRYEIILVDDGSTDGSADRARELARDWAGTLRVLEKANGGPASARNAGIRASNADIIAFTDSDCVAATNWVERLVETLTTSGAAGVGGPLINISPKGWVTHYLDAMAFFRHRVRNGQVDYLLTANVAFLRSALVDIGGFTERAGVWGEDADLSFRLLHQGYTLLLSKDGCVTHYGTPQAVQGLIKDLYRYGYGNCVLSHNWNNRRTPAKELLRHGGAVVLSPLIALSRTSTVGIWWAIAFWPLVVIEHSAFVAGLMSAWIRRGWRKE